MGSAGLSGYHNEARATGPGLVVGRSGASFGKVHYCSVDYWPLNTALFVTDFMGNDPRYVYYALTTLDLTKFNSGSAQPSLNRNFIASIPVPIPPKEDQIRIVSVLGVLDDKIDSNRRLAALLEQTAAELFRAQFVDFVGVEEFEDSEIGRIPRGWRVGSLLDTARFVNGRAFTKEANHLGRPILRIKELNGSVGSDTPYSDVGTADDHVARAHDILFAWSGSLDVYRWRGPESLINQHIFKVIPERYPLWFVHQWIQEHMAEFRAIARDKATTMGHIQRGHLAEAVVPLPDAEAVGCGEAVLGPIDNELNVLASEAATLTLIRDALLPKLISGAIRVPDATDPAEVIEPARAELAAVKR